MAHKDFWNERYCNEEYIYGTLPNEYLKEKLKDLKAGKILFPAEGEGRNAVYAAVKGWESEAFDQSEEGKKKALLWARKNNTEIFYTVSNVENIEYSTSSFDALALIYAHFPIDHRRDFHQKLTQLVKPGGYLILEGFSKLQQEYQQRDPQSGGPKDTEMLYDLEELKRDFENFDIKEAVVETIVLNEGNYHKGEASVVRIFAIKK